MLKLKNIRKVYMAGDEKVEALKGVTIRFRKNEFVSILGQSGCGKTTLLNIIGGLDQYTSGDLVINGRSTKLYRDRDWDTYRNHSVGFVFQSYNLIPHQSVLSNVELALTISGVSRRERRRRAAEALKKVGLGNQLHKKPNQMSGGQMQRVAIARALVNDPEILLADEPTGALDSATSIQIMNLLREIARDRLVIMVTHNPELARQYSTRIVRLLDGNIISDSNPYLGEKPRPGETREEFYRRRRMERAERERGKKRASMSFFTALSLSLRNLMTKKMRTFLTSFAGSIGIIGIALILSVSSGVQNYINAVQRDTLSSYPIEIDDVSVDIQGMMQDLMHTGNGDGDKTHDRDKVYENAVMYQLSKAFSQSNATVNNLTRFKQFLETDEEIRSHISAVHYVYGADMTIYTKDPDGKIIRADISSFIGDTESGSAAGSQNNMMMSFAKLGVLEEMLPGEGDALIHDLLKEQYDVVYGHWPEAYNEVVLVVDENNEISDLSLYALGLKSSDDFYESLRNEQNETTSFTYEEICAHGYKLLLKADHYRKNADGTYTDVTKTPDGKDSADGLEVIYANAGIDIRVSAIIRPKKDTVSTILSGAIGYTSALTDYLTEETLKRDIVKEQLADPTRDVITGKSFKTDVHSEKVAIAKTYLAGLTDAEKAALYRMMACVPSEEYLAQAKERYFAENTREQITASLTAIYAAQLGMSEAQIRAYVDSMSDENFYELASKLVEQQIAAQYAASMSATVAGWPDSLCVKYFNEKAETFTDKDYENIYDTYMTDTYAEASYEDNLEKIGYVNLDTPTSIKIFSRTFEDKDAIADSIARYNKTVESKEDEITYTDYVALLMSSISTIVNAISYVLIAFVAISLVVSSIMIGIITYISVLERTKEIGILRAIGASKRDISRVFNAETLIVGFAAGVIGIGFSLLLLLPINLIIHHLTGISTLSASLPVLGGVILVGISMLLTLVAGLIPSGLAARKDPVIALRSE